MDSEGFLLIFKEGRKTVQFWDRVVRVQVSFDTYKACNSGQVIPLRLSFLICKMGAGRLLA